MSTPVTAQLSRGQSGNSPFPVAAQNDMQVAYITVATTAERDALPTWRRMAFMTVYVVATALEYQLQNDLVTWTTKTYGLPTNLVHTTDIFDSNGYIQPQLIKNIFLNSSYVVGSQAAMLALTTYTGNFVVRTDTGLVYIKLNNNNGPALLTDFATSATPGLVSVNGQTGVVEVGITNMLARGTNTTDFNNAVTASPSVASALSSISSINSSITSINSTLANKADSTYVDTHLGGKAISSLVTGASSGQNGYAITWDNTNNRYTLTLITGGGGGGGGATQFTSLTDVPGSYTGQSLKAVRVNAGETALEFYTAGSSTLTQNHILVGNASNIATDVAMSGEASIVSSGAITLSNAAIIGKLLTGYVSGSGTISASDSILSAIQKLNGNVGLLTGAVIYQGTWNATTNTPTLTSGSGTKGYLYKVSVAGTTAIDGISQWNVGDSIVFDGTVWDKIDGIPTEVTSVFGRVGPVVAAAADYSGVAMTGITSVAAGLFTVGTLGYSDTGILSSFQSSVNSFNQVIIQNTNSGAGASTGYIVSNNSSTSTTFYGEFGMNSSGFTGSGSFNLPSAVYLTATSADLVLGTTTNNAIRFVVNNSTTDVMTISGAGAVTIPAFSTTGVVHNSVAGLLSTSLIVAADVTTNTLTYSKIQQVSALSILGNATNATANVAALAGTTDQIVRVDSTGTTVGFGSINLAAAAAVGASLLGIGNGGTGSATQVWWGLSGTSTLVAATTVTGSVVTPFTINGTWIATGTGQSHLSISPTITFLNATAQNTYGILLTPAFVHNNATQTSHALFIKPTITDTNGNTHNLIGLQLPTATTGVDNFVTGYSSSGTALFLINSFGLAWGSGNATIYAALNGVANSSGTGKGTIIKSTLDSTNSQGLSVTLTTAITDNTIAKYLIYTAGNVSVSSGSGGSFAQIAIIGTYNNTGGTTTIRGIDYSPALTSMTGTTHLAWRNTSGQMLIGGTNLVSQFTSMELAANTQALLLNKNTNAQESGITGVEGMIQYNTDVHFLKVYNGTTWAALGTSALANELMMSDGTNAVSSGIFTSGLGNLQLGTATVAGTARTVTPVGFGSVATALQLMGSQSATTGVSGGDLVLWGGKATVGNANSGNVYIDMQSAIGTGTVGNLALFVSSGGTFGGGQKVAFFGAATVAPASNPTGGALFYCDPTTFKPTWRTPGGVTYTLSDIGAGSFTVQQATLNFGAQTQQEFDASIFVGDVSVTSSSKIIVTLCVVATTDHTMEDIASTELTLSAGNVVAGSGFTIYGKCDAGTYGAYKINYIIQY